MGQVQREWGGGGEGRGVCGKKRGALKVSLWGHVDFSHPIKTFTLNFRSLLITLRFRIIGGAGIVGCVGNFSIY